MDYIDADNASYDTLAKRILSRKVILARILKYTVPEFADCSLEDIAGKYIEGDPTADINTIPLDDTLYIKGSQSQLLTIKIESLSIPYTSLRVAKFKR